MAQKQPPSNYRRTSTAINNAGTKAKPVIISLPEPHPRQFTMLEMVRKADVRFVIAACGTKFGKTFGCSIAIVRNAWENKNSLNWWVAPSFSQSKMAYGLVKKLLPKDTFVEYKADLKLVLLEPDGSEHSTIEFKSADNESSLRGFAVNFFVLDEASRVSYESFVSLMTTVTQTNGKGIIISTPKGRGWFFDVYSRGEKFEDDGVTPRFEQHLTTCSKHEGCLCPNVDIFPEWMAIRMPTWTNPHVPPNSVRQAKKNLPEDVFRQEFAAQFLDDSAGVFRGVDACIKGEMFEAPRAGARYVMGVDLARLRDYSVVIVLDANRHHVVYMERFNQIQWAVQYQRIIQVARAYRATVAVDSTGIGDPIVESLSNGGINVLPYKIGGSSSKQQLIEKLRVNIENQSISYPRNPLTSIMRNELKSYEYEFTSGGTIKYSAPQGKHDDAVIALALANMIGDVPAFKYHYSNHRGI